MASGDADDVSILELAAGKDPLDLERLMDLKQKSGDREAFRRMCDAVEDLSMWKPLHVAASNGRTDICKFLIEDVGVSINVETGRGNTPLKLALEKGYLSTVEYLIAQGANVSLSDCKGMIPLHYAVEKGSGTMFIGSAPVKSAAANEELMKLLLSKGSAIEANSMKGTPLQLAVSCRDLTAVQFWSSRGAKPNSVSPLAASSLASAIISNSPDCVKVLLKDRAVDYNPSSLGKSSLAHAAGGNENFVGRLITALANPNSIGIALMKPIEFAAFSGKRQAAKQLTSPVPFFLDWNLDGVLKSMDSGAAKENVWTPLQLAASCSNLTAVQFMLSRGAKPNSVSPLAASPLALAIISNSPDCVKVLLKIQQEKDLYFELTFERGKETLDRQDYSDAITWFSEAIYTDLTYVYTLLNRSLCWPNLNEGAFTLHDAQACVKLKPDLAEAHYREGGARRLLNKYPLAGRALGKAWDLVPGDQNIKKAYMETLYSGLLELIKNYQVETVEATLGMLKHTLNVDCNLQLNLEENNTKILKMTEDSREVRQRLNCKRDSAYNKGIDGRATILKLAATNSEKAAAVRERDNPTGLEEESNRLKEDADKEAQKATKSRDLAINERSALKSKVEEYLKVLPRSNLVFLPVALSILVAALDVAGVFTDFKAAHPESAKLWLILSVCFGFSSAILNGGVGWLEWHHETRFGKLIILVEFIVSFLAAVVPSCGLAHWLWPHSMFWTKGVEMFEKINSFFHISSGACSISIMSALGRIHHFLLQHKISPQLHELKKVGQNSIEALEECHTYREA